MPHMKCKKTFRLEETTDCPPIVKSMPLFARAIKLKFCLHELIEIEHVTTERSPIIFMVMRQTYVAKLAEFKSATRMFLTKQPSDEK